MTNTTARITPPRLAARAANAFGRIYQLVYAQLAPDLTIVQASSNFRSVLVDRDVTVEGALLADVLDEFRGTEAVLGSILQGAMPSFQLDRVARDLPDGSVRYLTFTVLLLDENQSDIGLLLLVENATLCSQLNQALIQSRNETRLMQDALSRAYDELQLLALDERKSAKQALETAYLELREAYDHTIEGWVRALDLRDRETETHTLRVTEMTVRLAREMGIGESEIAHIRRGALLHDIGKMGIPDSILNKLDALTPQDWDIMKKHPMYAYEMLSPIAYLLPALDIPYCHHEKWDGTGYPRELKGEEIPLPARIFAVVDVWDALRSNRPYRGGWPEKDVLDHIRSLSGVHFDPKVVDVFFKLLEEMSHDPGVADNN
jgi:putative nucleotidyltransferase with HDIG domain